jgi:hypothetical protein
MTKLLILVSLIVVKRCTIVWYSQEAHWLLRPLGNWKWILQFSFFLNQSIIRGHSRPSLVHCVLLLCFIFSSESKFLYLQDIISSDLIMSLQCLFMNLLLNCCYFNQRKKINHVMALYWKQQYILVVLYSLVHCVQ